MTQGNLFTYNQPDWFNPAAWRSNRWRTAISRPRLSSPLRLAIASLKLGSGTWLDFGCGRDLDKQYLQPLWSYPIESFDPYFQPCYSALEKQFSIISLIYVLNVIEDAQEREEVIQYLWNMKPQQLIVAVRCDGKGEGFTSIKTFQKYYAPQEFNDWLVSQIPQATIFQVRPGIAIVQRNKHG